MGCCGSQLLPCYAITLISALLPRLLDNRIPIKVFIDCGFGDSIERAGEVDTVGAQEGADRGEEGD